MEVSTEWAEVNTEWAEVNTEWAEVNSEWVYHQLKLALCQRGRKRTNLALHQVSTNLELDKPALDKPLRHHRFLPTVTR